MYWFESWLLHIWWQVSAYALRKQWGKVQVLGSVPMWKAQKLLTSTFKSVQLISGCYGCLVGEPEDGRFLSLSLFSMYICLKMKISKSLKEKKSNLLILKAKWQRQSMERVWEMAVVARAMPLWNQELKAWSCYPTGISVTHALGPSLLSKSQ